MSWLILPLTAIICTSSSSAFVIEQGACRRTTSSAELFMAGPGTGRGMGMAKPVNGFATKNKNKKKSTSSSSSPEFNVAASLLRLEKRYEELQKAAAKALASEEEDGAVTSDYVVATRALGYMDDWVPIAQICVTRSDEDAASVLPAVVSQYCRELSQVARAGSTLFQAIPRQLFQYSVETEASFHKFVFDPIVQGNLEKVEGEIMTKAMAKEVLELEDLATIIDSESKSRIKSAYRKKSFEYHPDRFVGKDQSAEEAVSTAKAYSQIQRAYETLSSGVNGSSSWYASLGGRARTDFIGPIDLMPHAIAVDATKDVESGLLGLDPAVVQQFVARSQQLTSSRKQI